MGNASGKTMPVAGVDYPRTFQEMDDWFRDEPECRAYIQRLRWPEGFTCPKCGVTGEPWLTNRDILRCRECRADTHLTAGTLFQDTRKPLRLWFLAMWFVTSQKNGVSALGLQRVLGLGSYETAWTWLHKLRRAMVRPGRDLLCGEVEVDETIVGGPEEGRKGRNIEDKALVVIAAEKRGRAIGRIRMKRIEEASAGTLVAFIRETVAPGTTIHTDGWRGYNGITAAGYNHRISVISASPEQAHELMPRVHKVASLLKRWLMGTLQGGIQKRHLDYYLDEFTFRFNRRTSRARGLLFHRLAQHAVDLDPVPYRELTHGSHL
jgi:transposase-like protein